MRINHEKLSARLFEAFTKKFSKSRALHDRAKRVLIDGGSHAIRLSEPFPPRISEAEGAYVTTEDGIRLLDFWQGHHANLLGHNPRVITEPLSDFFRSGAGLQTGFTDELQIECAELLCSATGAEAVRFTTSGSLATMYATLLARAYTKREMVMKIGGGWHGAQPWGLKGIDFHGSKRIFNEVDTAGLPSIFDEEVLVTSFNDTEMLEDHFKRRGDKIACFILEPFIGAGGFIPAAKEYIRRARELTEKYGSILIFDEVIDGFRFCAGSIGKIYDVTPDLAAYGKIIGGGMPVSAVAGKRNILELVAKDGDSKVRFSGGTFSGHPSSMLAAKLMMRYCLENGSSIYPKIGMLGERARRGAEQAFHDEGIYAYCTGGDGGILPGSSLGMIFFPCNEGEEIINPEAGRDASQCDTILSGGLLQTALLLEGVHVVHGFGSVSTAHGEEEIESFIEACRRTAHLFAEYSY